MGEDGPIRPTANEEDVRWASRPWLARSLRMLAMLAPAGVSFVASLWFVRTWPQDRVGVPFVVWMAALLTASAIVLFAADRLARKLLPLAALLKLSLVFPDKAPSRFSVAMRTGTTRQLQRRVDDLVESGLGTNTTDHAASLLELVAGLSTHDRLTRGHCERVRAYTDLISEEMNLPQADQDRLRWAALIHDIGKLHVPAEILNKEGLPTEAEWEVLKTHTTLGAKLAEPLRPWLGDWVDAVGHHHEHWNGAGYPEGLAAKSIPLAARIVSVADAFDVMTSTRSYKKPRPSEEARAEIAACAGSQFDPHVVRAFLNIGLGRLRLVMGPLSWLLNVSGPGATGLGPVIPAGAVAAAAVTGVAGITAGLAALLGSVGGPLGVLSESSEQAVGDVMVVASSLPADQQEPPASLPLLAPTSNPNPAAQPGTQPGPGLASSTTVKDQSGSTSSISSSFSSTSALPGATTSTSAGNTSTSASAGPTTTTTAPTTTSTSAPTTTTTTAPTTTTTLPTGGDGLALSPFAGDLVITEYLHQTNGSTAEFIEIQNMTGSAIDLAAFTLQDWKPTGIQDGPWIPGNGNKQSFTEGFNENPSTLQPGARAVIWVDGSTMSVPGGTLEFFDSSGPTLESTGDDLWLLDSNGDVVDYIGWRDPAFAGSNALEWSGEPDPILGFDATYIVTYSGSNRGLSYNGNGVIGSPTPGS